MESILKRITPWIPFFIAAGYFLFLVATWQRFIVNMDQNNRKLDDLIEKLSPVSPTESDDKI